MSRTAPPSLASEQSQITIQKQFRGLDRGASIEFPLKTGRVTIARLGVRQNGYRMFIATGEALPTGMILRGTCSRVKMDAPVSDVLERIATNGIAHHYAIVYGDHREKLLEVCQLLDIEVVQC